MTSTLLIAATLPMADRMTLPREVYPDFQGVTFPKGTTKAIG